MLKNQDISLHVQICGFPWKTGRCGNTESIFPKATNCLEVTSDFSLFFFFDKWLLEGLCQRQCPLRLAISVSDKKPVNCHLSWHLYYCSLKVNVVKKRDIFSVLLSSQKQNNEKGLLFSTNLFILITSLDPTGLKGYDCLHSMTFQYKIDYVAICCTMEFASSLWSLLLSSLPSSHLSGSSMRAEIFVSRTVPETWKGLNKYLLKTFIEPLLCESIIGYIYKCYLIEKNY